MVVASEIISWVMREHDHVLLLACSGATLEQGLGRSPTSREIRHALRLTCFCRIPRARVLGGIVEIQSHYFHAKLWVLNVPTNVGHVEEVPVIDVGVELIALRP